MKKDTLKKSKLSGIFFYEVVTFYKKMVIYRYRYLKGVLEQNERSEADKTIYE